MRTGKKSVMTEVLSSGTKRPWVTRIAGRSTLGLLMELEEGNIFNDLGDKFVKAVLASGLDIIE